MNNTVYRTTENQIRRAWCQIYTRWGKTNWLKPRKWCVMERKLKTNQGKQRNKTVIHSTQSMRSPINLKGLRELRTFLLTGVTSKTLYSSSWKEIKIFLSPAFMKVECYGDSLLLPGRLHSVFLGKDDFLFTLFASVSRPRAGILNNLLGTE